MYIIKNSEYQEQGKIALLKQSNSLVLKNKFYTVLNKINKKREKERMLISRIRLFFK